MGVSWFVSVALTFALFLIIISTKSSLPEMVNVIIMRFLVFFLGESHKLCTIVMISGFMQCRLAVIVWLIDICSIFNKKFPVFHISCEMQLFILKEMYEFTSAIVRGKHRKPLKKNFSVFWLPLKYQLVLPLRAASCNGVLPNVVATPTFAPFLIKRSAISTLPKWILNNEHSFPTKTTI